MKFYDPTEIPLDKYREAIVDSVDCVKKILEDENSKDFFKFFAEHYTNYFDLTTKIDEYELSDEDVADIRSAVSNLYYCLNSSAKNLAQICSAYEIDQGHLGYDHENHVFDQVKQMTIAAIGETSEF